MPALENYDIFLDLTNDMHDPVSIQLLRDYDRQTGRVVLLHPTESLTLILESGSSYQYAVKFRTKVANVTAKSWKDITCSISQLFTGSPTSDSLTSSVSSAVSGVRVDRLWRDHRFSIWNEA
ncbi:hypothetical protein JR316_0000922 [Psilocybe cubensis]|uniref:Uncharacterized protein n=2 Tax=Psilocybe cubensis TaxID=181762 RepID=A0ACB8HGM7_PSICU|nr:hypothetical protein JR316_0000922 [Psilocybe cubensis]KAH9486857.1 hypothetical protein JR316_0000922 [Psilocybe cubensis]